MFPPIHYRDPLSSGRDWPRKEPLSQYHVQSILLSQQEVQQDPGLRNVKYPGDQKELQAGLGWRGERITVDESVPASCASSRNSGSINVYDRYWEIVIVIIIISTNYICPLPEVASTVGEEKSWKYKLIPPSASPLHQHSCPILHPFSPTLLL